MTSPRRLSSSLSGATAGAARPGLSIRVHVLGLGPRDLTAAEAEDMGIRNGETIGPRTWDVLVAQARVVA